MEQSCKAELVACDASATCTCWVSCFDGSNQDECEAKCGAWDNPAVQLLLCVQQSCDQDCLGGGGQGGGGGSGGQGGGKPDAGPGGAGGSGAGDGGVNTPCQACMEQSCKGEVAACDASTVCTCWSSCYDGSNQDVCQAKCGDPDGPTLQLAICVQQDCNQVCLGGGGQGGSGGGSADGGVSKPCQACMTQNCSTQLASCKASTVCTCWSSCYDGSNQTDCEAKCGTWDTAAMQLLLCAQQSCDKDCPF